jgi:4,5-dihydroxyphthalate decarboxylase
VSSSIWQRQILRQLYGVAEDQFAWVTLNPERMEELRIPDGVKQRRDASGRSMRDLAAAGEIDASLAAGAANPPGQPDPLIPAFPDREQAMRDYYGQTGIFPIVHITVLKRELVEREPWISESLVEAYLQAKRVAESRLASESAPAGEADDNPEDTVRALGGDPWAYGIGPNRKALEAFVATAHDQGLVGRRFTVDELFVPNLSEELS